LVKEISMISTRDLRLLPDPNKFRAVFQALAALETILLRDKMANYRYFRFDPARPSERVDVGWMENGSGDDLQAAFGPVGCLVCGFAHEAVMSPYMLEPQGIHPGVVDQIPADFAECVAALPPHFLQEDVTFCIWRRHSDPEWCRGQIEFLDHPDPDGSEDLLQYYDGRPETFCDWAEHYHSRSLDLEVVRWVFDHRPFTEDVVRALNPELTLDDVADELLDIGYSCVFTET
jgi:hypothetical protein